MSRYNASRQGGKNWRAPDQRNTFQKRPQPNRQGEYGNSHAAFDMSRFESFMESISRSMATLTGRMNALEKGPPSPHGVSNQPKANTNPPSLLTDSYAARASLPAHPGPSSASLSRRPAPTLTNSKPAERAMRPSETIPQSSNPDFQQVCKSLYRVVQIRRHMESWRTLPASIDRDLRYFASNIKPIQPTEDLTHDISSLFNRTGSELQERVSRHLSDCLASNLATLKLSNPLDKEQAIAIVIRQLSNRLGKKVTEPALRQMVVEESKVIGTADRFIKPKKSAKRQCMSDSPPAATHNTFSTLANSEEDVEEMEQASPSPTRKTRNLPITPGQKPSLATSVPRVSPHHSSTTSGLKTPKDSIPPTMGSGTSSNTVPPAPSPQSCPTNSQPAQSTPTSSGHLASSRFTIHRGTPKSLRRVKLLPNTKQLIITDSNFKFITGNDVPAGFQLDCFPGADFRNILHVVRGLPRSVDRIIFALGINHKEEDFNMDILPAIDTFLEACEDKTVDPMIAVSVSINPCLPVLQKDTLSLINDYLDQACSNYFIQPLADNEIRTVEGDKIHYNTDTQLKILNNIIQFAKN